MNLNDKMCEVGAKNLAEFLCMDLSEGEGGTTIQKIKSFKVVYQSEPTMIVREVQEYRIAVAIPTYIVKYIANPTAVVKVADNTIIVKGC